MEVCRSRDVDSWIAENVFGWGTMRVPPDANGENECEILVPPEGLSSAFTFAPKGKVHRGFLTPSFTSHAGDAVKFAQKVGITHISTSYINNPLAVCRLAMKKFLTSREEVS